MRKALGRGLDALIPGAGKPIAMPIEPAPLPQPLELAVDELTPNPRQPRTEFDETGLAELAASIRSQGMIQPVVVRPIGDGRYELVAGERRLRAAQLAGLKQVPVVVREVSDGESLELALMENVQRNDLTPLEEAAAYQRLMDEFGHTQEEIAERVGKSRPAIANTLRLLRLPETVKRELASGKLSAGHARVLLGLEDGAAQMRAARQILTRKLSVRDAEQLVAARRETSRGAPRDPHRVALERELSAALGTRVRIHPRGRGGRIEIEYYSDEELRGLSERLRQPRAEF